MTVGTDPTNPRLSRRRQDSALCAPSPQNHQVGTRSERLRAMHARLNTACRGQGTDWSRTDTYLVGSHNPPTAAPRCLASHSLQGEVQPLSSRGGWMIGAEGCIEEGEGAQCRSWCMYLYSKVLRIPLLLLLAACPILACVSHPSPSTNVQSTYCVAVIRFCCPGISSIGVGGFRASSAFHQRPSLKKPWHPLDRSSLDKFLIVRLLDTQLARETKVIIAITQ